MEFAIQTKDLTKQYRQGKNIVTGVDRVNISIAAGSFTSIVGRSGSGKSTLLHLLGGIDQPTKGSIIINNTNLNQLGDTALTKFRGKNIGFIFQSYNLINELTVLENIRLPLDLGGIAYDKGYEADIIALLALEDRMRFYPYQLSGGQQQRVAIARALIAKPAIILADEPTGNLDKQSGDLLFEFMMKTNKSLNQTYVMVTHNLELANRTKRILTIDDGKIVDDRALI